MMRGGIAAVLTAIMLLAGPLAAQPTSIVVRALAKDAKFIGESMGSVEVTLRDATTGRVLAQGETRGSTGDTQRIIAEPRVRGQALADDMTARWDALIDIDVPTLVRAEARGPMGHPGSAVRVTSEMWVLPGKPISGDGWVLEFPGLVVEPQAEVQPGGGVRLVSKVMMMCGCSLEPGGHWDATHYDVHATLRAQGRAVADIALVFDGTPSRFAATLPPLPPGRYDILVTAHNAATGNSGIGRTLVDVPRR